MSSSILKVAIFPDVNQWCALIGKDLQEGIAGFGDNPLQALKTLVEEIEKKGYSLIQTRKGIVFAIPKECNTKESGCGFGKVIF
ncbi:hypothetical protein KAX97_14790 [candidate division WOR-3 bacterium]|nr:hypothetical protein [candidate division WOR-3 bacterium]